MIVRRVRDVNVESLVVILSEGFDEDLMLKG